MKKKKSGKGKKILWICLIVFVVIGVIEYIVDPTAYKTSAVPSPTLETRAVEETPAPVTWESYGTHTVTYGSIDAAEIDEEMNALTFVVMRPDSSSSPTTMDQNYYNVCEIVFNQGADQFDWIFYYLYTEIPNSMPECNLSFVVPKETIAKIKTGEYSYADLNDHVEELMVTNF